MAARVNWHVCIVVHDEVARDRAGGHVSGRVPTSCKKIRRFTRASKPIVRAASRSAR